MTRERGLSAMLVASIAACGPDPIVSGATELGDESGANEADGGASETGADSDPTDDSDPLPDPDPTPDPAPILDLPSETDGLCAALEADYQALLLELRSCETRYDCRLHLDGDRCGCSYATNRDAAVDEVLLPLAAELDAVGCPAACDDSCGLANFARCNEGLCEATVAGK